VRTCDDAVRSDDVRFSAYDNDQLLRRMAVIAADGTVTTAGLMALGEYPQQFLPNFAVQAAVLPEPGAGPLVRVEDTKRFAGSISDMIDGAVAWTRSHSRHRILNRPDGRVVDQFDFPVVAVRELVANSLVHRDLAPWAWSRSIDLRIDSDKLLLTNPGGLYGVSVSRLGQQSVSSARNSHLLRICQFTRTADGRTVEALATGIPLVFAETDKQGLPRPTFFDQALTFTAILHRAHTATEATPSGRGIEAGYSPADGAVLRVLADGPLPIAEIARRLGISPNATRARLVRLRGRGESRSSAAKACQVRRTGSRNPHRVGTSSKSSSSTRRRAASCAAGPFAWSTSAEGRVRLRVLSGIAQLPTALIRARIACGLTQRQLAERVGLQEQAIQRYESSDYATVSFARLVDIAMRAPNACGARSNNCVTAPCHTDRCRVVAVGESVIARFPQV
jgi:DNA-binding CsgD family transcriptional regulator